MKMEWVYKGPADDKVTRELSEAINVNAILSRILVRRGVTSYEEAKKFFRPSLDDLHDPLLMNDMDKAVDRVLKAVDAGERILIYGDYDVDGTTAVAMTYSYLKSLSDKVDYYLPDRYTEGYGLSEAGIKFAVNNGFKLVITLDCGIRAVDRIHDGVMAGIDFIVCDHHLPSDVMPEAIAILDPKKPKCTYPYDELSGCGIGFKLIQALNSRLGLPQDRIMQFIDLVALSICADIVPMTGENRILTYYGLNKLNTDPLLGLAALKRVAGLNKTIDVSGVVFGLAPRINAAGRINHARDAVKSLLAIDQEKAEEGATELNTHNIERKDLDEVTTQEALKMIEENDALHQLKSTVLYNSKWHKGVIGIVASRLMEHYYRPTIILTESEGMATGSARSVSGFNIYKAIKACEDLLEQFGGHKYAAGLTLQIEDVPIFQQRFEEVVSDSISDEQLTPKIQIDESLDFEKVNSNFYSIVKQMAPFGPENAAPIFATEKVQCVNARLINERHLKLFLRQPDSKCMMEAMAFRKGELLDQVIGKTFAIAYHIEDNTFQGDEYLQLVIKDFKIPDE